MKTDDPVLPVDVFRGEARDVGLRATEMPAALEIGAWAERAKSCGYPERFAQEALGHTSKAVHRAYSKKAQVTLPALEDYERKQAVAAVVPMPRAAAS